MNFAQDILPTGLNLLAPLDMDTKVEKALK